MKNELLKTFNNLYKGCTLYAIHLDEFTHTVFYKDSEGNRHVDYVSGYDSSHDDDHVVENAYGQKVTRSYNKDKTKVLFSSYSHLQYSHGNAKEIVYKDNKEW